MQIRTKTYSSWIPASGPSCARSRLYIEPEVHHVALADDIFLPFQPQFAGLFRSRLALVGNEITIGDDFGANEPMLEVRVNDARCLRRGRSRANGPRAHFFDTRREVSLQSQQGIPAANHAVESGLVQLQFLQEIRAV